MDKLHKFKKSIKIKIYKNLFLFKLFRFYKNLDVINNKPFVKDIVICGIQRSGSTLLYNIVKKVIEKREYKTDTFFKNDREYKNILKNEISPIVKKTHSYSHLLAKRIKKRKTIAFFTHRDIRDIVLSAQKKGMISNLNFNRIQDYLWLKSIINNSLLYIKVPNINVISYNELVIEPENVIKKVSHLLDVKLENDEIDTIKKELSLDNVKKNLQNIPKNHRRNLKNQFHKNHIDDGKIDKWKVKLSEYQIKTIENISSKYIEMFNYKLHVENNNQNDH